MKKIRVSILAFASCLLSLNSFAAGDIAAGQAITQKYGCSACHGADYQSPKDPTIPKLAGQHQDYLEHALIEYRRGAGAVNGRVNAMMGAQIKQLSRQDVQNVAAYLHSLPGTLVVRK